MESGAVSLGECQWRNHPSRTRCHTQIRVMKDLTREPSQVPEWEQHSICLGESVQRNGGRYVRTQEQEHPHSELLLKELKGPPGRCVCSWIFSRIDKLWPTAQIWCLLWYATNEVRLVFAFINGWGKNQKKNTISGHIKIVWNSKFSVYKFCFIGTQPCPFIYVSSLAAFALQ